MLLSTLKIELATDPKGLGYAPLVAVGNDQAVADLLNAKTGPGAEAISLAVIPKGDFLLGIAPAAMVLATKDDATQRRWDRLIALASASDQIRVGSPTIQGLLAQAVGEGLLAQGQVDGFTKRVGSRAEVLFGPGAMLTTTQIGEARNG